MQFNMNYRLSRACLAALASLTVCHAHAESDVLERPAQMRAIERSAASVMLDIGRAGNRLVAVGERGLILWSDDEGKSWQQAKTPVSVTLTSVFFADAETGWAVGHSGVILRSDDRGRTWNKTLDGKQAAALVAEAAKMPGAAAELVASADRLIADGPDKPFLSVRFFDRRHGLVVGAYGLILETQDGGKNWRPRQQSVDNPKGLHLYSILDKGGSIWLSGEQGGLFSARNKGDAYRAVTTPYAGTFFGIAATDSSLVAYGMRGNAYWSGDQGVTWQKCILPGSNTLTAALTTRAGELMLVDDGGNVFLSADGGKQFVRASIPKMGPLNAVVELADGEFLFAGARGLSRARLSTTSATENKS